MGITLALFIVLTITFGVLAAIQYGRASDRLRKINELEQGQSEIIRADERNRDDVRALIEESKRARQSLVGFLADSRGSIMERVTGSRRDTFQGLTTRLEGIQGADASPLLTIIQSRDNEIASLRQQVQQADAARQAAAADLQNEVARVQALQASHQQTVDAITGEVAQYRNEIERFRTEAEAYKARVDQQRSSERTEAAEAQKRLQDQLTRLTEESLILRDQLQALRGQRNQEIFRGSAEDALVDGQIIGVDNAQGVAFLSIGGRQKVTLGMTFSVYSDGRAIRLDDQGNYPRPKATLEVINVADNTATARITGELRGNPVVKGDVVANALFDPNKVYRFVVFGAFDVNRDGIATENEREDLVALIRAWGGTVVNDLSGDVDFLVLGQRPITPPRPSVDAPLEVVQQFAFAQRQAERYDSLFRQAGATSIPVLSENRLYTLIGKTPAGRPN
jgi:hypothetical protein